MGTLKWRAPAESLQYQHGTDMVFLIDQGRGDMVVTGGWVQDADRRFPDLRFFHLSWGNGNRKVTDPSIKGFMLAADLIALNT